MDVVCGLTAFMVTQNKKINENNKQTPQKKREENYNKTRKLLQRIANRNAYALSKILSHKKKKKKQIKIWTRLIQLY